MPRVVLLHGAATTAAVWDPVVALLADLDVTTPDRPRTGDLDRELAWLAPQVAGSFVVGMSGGATLGLALTALDLGLVGALLHEPAVGSLAPGLLAGVAAAFAAGGLAAFGRALYGPSWEPAMAGEVGEDVIARELAMFRGFEPAPPRPSCGPVVVTYGERSGPPRQHAAEVVGARDGHTVRAVPGAGHFVAHDSPGTFAAEIRAALAHC